MSVSLVLWQRSVLPDWHSEKQNILQGWHLSVHAPADALCLHICIKDLNLHLCKFLACVQVLLSICILVLCCPVRDFMGKQIWCDLIEHDYSVFVFPVRHSLLFMCPFHWGLAPEGPWSQQLYLPLGQPSSPKGLYELCLPVFPLSGMCFFKT